MTSLTAPMRTMNKRPSTQRKKPSRLSLSELNGLHDGWLSLTGKWRLYFGKRCDSGGVLKQPLKLWPTARRLEKVTPDMRPAKGQNQLVTVQGQAFIGTVAVTHQDALHQVSLELIKMRFGDFGPPTRRHAVVHHRGRLHHPQI